MLTGPLLLIALTRLNIFDPYYWYVLANERNLEKAAETRAAGQTPAFAVLETRDVSVGLATNLPSYISLIFDDTDQIGLDPARRSPEWGTKNEWLLQRASGGYPYSVVHLRDHFYLLQAGG